MDFIIVNGKAQLFTQSYGSWSSVKEHRQPDGVLLDIGGQVDLELVAEDLQRAARSICSETLQSDVSAYTAVEEAICEAYRTSWNQPDKQQVLRSGSNLMLMCESDVTLPECFSENEDLRRHYDTIQACAQRVARRYVLSLHGSNDDVQVSLQVIGPLGFLFLDLFSARLKSRSKLLSHGDWQAMEDALKSTRVKNLVVVSEFAVVDDIPVDAQVQSEINHNKQRRSWSLHKSECEHLLALLFAWKAQQSGRQVLVTAGSREHGFRTTIALEEAGMQLEQIVAAPLRKHANAPFNFAQTGSFVSSTSHSGDVTYRFTYKHFGHWENGSKFLVVRMGSGRLESKMNSALEEGSTYRSLPVWLVAAIVTGQRSFEQRSAREKEFAASRPQRDAERQAIEEMKEEHPELELFPIIVDEEKTEQMEAPLIELKWINLDTSIYPTNCKLGLTELDKRFDTKGVMRAVEELFETYKDEEGVLEDDCVKLLLCFLGQMDESRVGLTDLVHVPLEKIWLEDLAVFTTRFAWETPCEKGLSKDDCHGLVKVFLALVLIANEFWP